MKARVLKSAFVRNVPIFLEQSLTVFNHQPSGMAAKKRDLALFIQFVTESKRKIINGDAILDFIAHLRQKRGNESGSINRKISTLRTYLKHLRFLGVDGANALPIEDLPRARAPYPRQVEVPEPEEIKRFFESINRQSILGGRDYTLYSLLYRLGLRPGEAVALNLSNIDLAKKTITIHGKGRRMRTLPLLDDVVQKLATWLALRAKLKNAETEQALFLSRKGKRLSLRTVEENFQKQAKAAGGFSKDRFVPHTLRHAFASHALETTSDLAVLKHTLGHSHLSSTEIYLHPSMRLLRKALHDHPAAETLAELLLCGDINIPVCQQDARRKGA